MIQELRTQNNVLRAQVAQAPQALPATKVKVPKPDLYYGDRKKTQVFLFQLDDYIHFS